MPEDVIEPFCATVDTSKRHAKITRDTGRVDQSYLMGVLMRMCQKVESRILSEQNVGSDVGIHHRLNLIRVLLHKLLSLHPTSIVHNDVDGTESIDSGLDNLLTELNGVVVGYCLATGCLDFSDDHVSWVVLLGLTRDGTTEVVDNNLGTTRGEEEGVDLAETVPAPVTIATLLSNLISLI